MSKCRVCGATVAGSAWKCQQCGSYYANASMIWARIVLGALIIGFLLYVILR